MAERRWQERQCLSGLWQIDAPFPIWLLTTPRMHAASLLQLLSDEERARADRFHTDFLRNRYIAAHGGLRLLIERQFGIAAADQRFSCNALGKPSLLGRNEVRSNISYSGPYALVGLSGGGEIGVDIEAVRPIADAAELAALYYTPAERSALRHDLDGAKSFDEGFLRLWVRKEACVKALGQGLSIPLSTVECGTGGGTTTVTFDEIGIFTGVVHMPMDAMHYSPGGLFIGWARI